MGVNEAVLEIMMFEGLLVAISTKSSPIVLARHFGTYLARKGVKSALVGYGAREMRRSSMSFVSLVSDG